MAHKISVSRVASGRRWLLGCAAGVAAFWAHAAMAATTVKLSASYNHPGGNVAVSGAGFGAAEAVDIFFDTTDLQLAVTDASGAMASTTITAPPAAQPGTHYITAIGRRTGSAAQVSFLVRTNWAEYGFGAHNSRYNPYENTLSVATIAGLDEAWAFTAGGAVTTSGAAVYNGLLYFGGGDGYLYALNAATGALAWKTATAGAITSTPAAAANVVYVGSGDGSIYAFNSANGAKLWSYATGGNVSSSPSVANGVVYCGSDDTFLYALNAKTGALIWKTGYAGGSVGLSSPAVVGGLVFLSAYNSLFAVNAANGARVWGSPLNSAYTSAPLVANGTVIAVDYGMPNGTAWALLPSNGSISWSASWGSGTDAYTGGLAAANGVLVLTDDKGEVLTYDTVTGSLLWAVQTIYPFASVVPAIAGGLIFHGSATGFLAAWDIKTGQQVWHQRVAGAVESVTVVNGMVYAGGSDNAMHAYALGAGSAARHPTPRPSIAQLRSLQLR